MQTSEKKDILRAVFAAVAFVLICVLFCSAFYFAADDGALILPDNTDTLYCGASHCEMAFVPDLIDGQLGTVSANVSIQSLRLNGREILLDKLTDALPVRTVVLELSYNVFLNDETKSYQGDALAHRYFGNYLDGSFQYGTPNPLERAQSAVNLNMKAGLEVYLTRVKYMLHGDFGTDCLHRDQKNLNRGFVGYGARSVALDEKEVPDLYHRTGESSADYLDDNIQSAERIIDMCRKKGAEVIVVVVPLSDAFIWQHDGLDEFYTFMKEFCDRNGCALYDFNLIKDRYTLFNDTESFYEECHLSESGAASFSASYAEVMQKVKNGEDVSPLFYESYAEMISGSPYWAYVPDTPDNVG